MSSSCSNCSVKEVVYEAIEAGRKQSLFYSNMLSDEGAVKLRTLVVESLAKNRDFLEKKKKSYLETEYLLSFSRIERNARKLTNAFASSELLIK